MSVFQKISKSFRDCFSCGNEDARKDKAIYDKKNKKNSKKLDKTIEDSFPASDPPANY